VADKLIRLREVSKDFVVDRSLLGRPTLLLSAVSNVSFDIFEGEMLGLVGESGSGKTTLGRLILRLLSPTSGKIFFREQEIFALDSRGVKEFRSQAQIVFQDPYSSFDPRMRVGEIVAEGMPRGFKKAEARERVAELLSMVGLSASYTRRFPHQLSGGERQRVGVARALAVDPGFIVLDEPVSALDVSVQAQILNLLKDLRGRLNLTFLLIAHDLRVVKHMSDRVAVMYLGQLMEVGTKKQIYESPFHPYTQALLSAIPVISRSEAQRRRRVILGGEIPSPIDVPAGCRFAGRCRFTQDHCQQATPPSEEVAEGHWVACFEHPVGAALAERAT
jgi:oligopeptide/dipeptide ABC transporter ATP-binding protein